MPKKVAISNLHGSTTEILNIIRANASEEYKSLIPKMDNNLKTLNKIGDTLYGYPDLANQFLNALINRIAIVRVKSVLFNNPLARLKKGYLSTGETIEEIYVNLAKSTPFDVEKAPAEEFKRNIPDVRTAFHTMNYRVKYPVTIQNEDLRQAFVSFEGVENLISKIIDSIYTSAEYDEFLMFKYMLIKGVNKSNITLVAGGTTPLENAEAFRGMSNSFLFPSKDYNESGVVANTPRERQVILMDAKYNAKFDVNVLASAFHMDKADFMGSLILIDDFSKFDNERFETIREYDNSIEEVTETELEAMKTVKAILVDEDYFQVYELLSQFTEKYVASGLYWNYFYHVWKTFSHSPFSNIVAFVESSLDTNTTAPDDLKVEIVGKEINETSTIFTIATPNDVEEGGSPAFYEFVQDEANTTNGIAVHKYGVIIIPSGKISASVTVKHLATGTVYTAVAGEEGANTLTTSSVVGDTLTLTK